MGSSVKSTGAPLSSRVSAQAEVDGTEFAPGGDFTVGAEEELLVVNASDELVGDGCGTLISDLGIQLNASGIVSSELFRPEIEFSTIASRDAEGVRACLAAFRGTLRRAGVRVMAAGLHPAAEFGHVDLTRSTRYDSIGSNLAGLLRTPTAALQIHVGLPDSRAAVAAFRGLRNQLALLRALSAGSPYWHGQDSGLASARWAVLRSYPRSGIPPAVGCWEEYVALVQAVTDAAEVPDYTHVWWDLRAQPRLGTLEIRVMDVQPSLDGVAGLTALVQGIARCAVERPSSIDIPGEVLTENDFRAARYGLDARIVDVAGSMRPVRELAAEAVAQARAVLVPDGLDEPLCAIEQIISDEPEPTRQRRIGSALGMSALLDDLVTRTTEAR